MNLRRRRAKHTSTATRVAHETIFWPIEEETFNLCSILSTEVGIGFPFSKTLLLEQKVSSLASSLQFSGRLIKVPDKVEPKPIRTHFKSFSCIMPILQPLPIYLLRSRTAASVWDDGKSIAAVMGHSEIAISVMDFQAEMF